MSTDGGATRGCMTVKERNVLFLEAIAEALQLDSVPETLNFADLKRRFTPQAVKSIHERVVALWPDDEDYRTCMQSERGSVQGLYCGSFEPGAVFRAITRHSLYCDRIVLPDPFVYSQHVADQFNPLLHPEQHRAMTLKWTFLWFSLIPWIEAGLVSLVRKPSDFDPAAFREILDIQEEKFRTTPELATALRAAAEVEVREDMRRQDGFAEYMMLAQSDDALRQRFREAGGAAAAVTEEGFLAHIRDRRDAHPYFVERLPDQAREFIMETTGASYEEAKRMCHLANYHLVTDKPSKWKELELDHRDAGPATATWSPFARALQNANLKVLNEVPLSASFRLREEQRLEQMRLFFVRVWKACGDPDSYAPGMAEGLAAELDERVREAQEEWQRIDRDLLGMFGGGAFLGMITAGASGFAPAALAAAVAGTTALGVSQLRRASFRSRFPAGFFLA